MKSTVLITTAIAPPAGMPYLKITNVATRQLTTKAGIFFWAAQGIQRIVVADATGKTALNEEDVASLRQMNVEVEQVSYLQEDAVITRKGKGYGEGKLIEFALRNSVFLREADHFFKCTGKVYCRNFRSIVQLIEKNNIEQLFWRWMEPEPYFKNWADVRFFYSTKEFCEQRLIPAYLQSDDHVQAVESLCFNMLEKALGAALVIRPLLSGFCGGTGEQYFDSSLGALDTYYPCWITVKK